MKKDLETYISSGILESYVMGMASAEEVEEIESLMEKHEEIRQEVDNISLAVEAYTLAHSVKPPSGLKSRIIGTIKNTDSLYINQLPDLSLNSSPDQWEAIIKDFDAPAEYENVFMIPLPPHKGVESFVAWAKEGIPEEIHKDTLESFVVLEGTCTCYIGDTETLMERGDYMQIPLHILHSVKVTSEEPLKVILQKKAA